MLPPHQVFGVIRDYLSLGDLARASCVSRDFYHGLCCRERVAALQADLGRVMRAGVFEEGELVLPSAAEPGYYWRVTGGKPCMARRIWLSPTSLRYDFVLEGFITLGPLSISHHSPVAPWEFPGLAPGFCFKSESPHLADGVANCVHHLALSM